MVNGLSSCRIISSRRARSYHFRREIINLPILSKSYRTKHTADGSFCIFKQHAFNVNELERIYTYIVALEGYLYFCLSILIWCENSCNVKHSEYCILNAAQTIMEFDHHTGTPGRYFGRRNLTTASLALQQQQPDLAETEGILPTNQSRTLRFRLLWTSNDTNGPVMAAMVTI